jgi:hypothetical protein
MSYVCKGQCPKEADMNDPKTDPRQVARELHLQDDAGKDSENFPQLWTLSPKFFYRFLPVPKEIGPVPEYAYVNDPHYIRSLTQEEKAEYEIFVANWNNTWEARGLRSEMFDERVPKRLRWVVTHGKNLRLVVRNPVHSYDAYAPLYHLLPRKTLEKFGLPLLRRGNWPHLMAHHLLEHVVPSDFNARLQQAFAHHIWPLLGSRGIPSAYSRNEPVRLLSHSLDYWMPYIDLVAQSVCAGFGRTGFDDAKEVADFDLHKNDMPAGVTLATPLRGGTIWAGEKEALAVTKEMVEVADRAGQLRAIIDAVRANRVKDDFSDVWSFEREDFERKLYAKRSKVKVKFVEVDETIPVHGPESELHENLIWQDLFSVLNQKERLVVVCLRNGVTRLADMAKELGYANHSPISKALARIRKKARKLFA